MLHYWKNKCACTLGYLYLCLFTQGIAKVGENTIEILFEVCALYVYYVYVCLCACVCACECVFVCVRVCM